MGVKVCETNPDAATGAPRAAALDGADCADAVVSRTVPETERRPPHVPDAADSGPAAQSRVPRLRWLCRSRRVALALAAVWVLSAFDLGFTLHQARSSHFVEKNPLAARLLHASPLVLAAYKFALLGAATLILASLRGYAVAELASWFLLATCFYVGVRWYIYYEGALNLRADVLTDMLP